MLLLLFLPKLLGRFLQKTKQNNNIAKSNNVRKGQNGLPVNIKRQYCATNILVDRPDAIIIRKIR